ncbi:MAG: ABC transporter permease, partial [Bifidobacterium sp.]|nr:ABC transporter permease [Bifidobacterium sp.]
MARIFALRSVLRLAWRDMCRHRARTTFSTLLIALPMMALIVGATLMTGAPPMRERAVRSIPEGAQAVITATAVKRDGNPFEQPPEGASIWMDEITQQPASEDELKRIVPSSDKLLPYWDSEQLIAATATGLQPGQVESAKNSSIGGTLAQSGTGTARLCEAGAEALGMLLPKLSEGTVPSNADEIVVTSGLASRIGADIGDTITLIAPPFQGSYSTNGRIAAVIQ